MGNVETRPLKSGGTVSNISVATNKKIKGEQVTDWHNICAYNKMSDLAAKYLNKGDIVGIEGELNYQKFTTKEGNQVEKAVVIAHKFTYFPRNNGNPNGNQADNYGNSSEPNYAGLNDDVPF